MKDLCLYRVRFDSRNKIYILTLVTPQDYTNDIFGQKKFSATFFLCHNKDPRSQLLTRYKPEEEKVRNDHCDKLIKFVKRRDLDKTYLTIYENRKNEVYRLMSFDRSGNPVEEDLHDFEMGGRSEIDPEWSEDEEEEESKQNQSSVIEGTVDIPYRSNELADT